MMISREELRELYSNIEDINAPTKSITFGMLDYSKIFGTEECTEDERKVSVYINVLMHIGRVLLFSVGLFCMFIMFVVICVLAIAYPIIELCKSAYYAFL